MAPLTRFRKRNGFIPEFEITRCNKKKKKMPKTAPGQEILFVDMEKINYIESNKREFTIFPDAKDMKGQRRQLGPSIRTFIPSKTNHQQLVYEFYPSEDYNQEDLLPNNINPHIEAIQKLINTSFNFVRNYEFLMDSANEVLRILHWFLYHSKSPRFDVRRKAFLPPYRKSSDICLLPQPKDRVNICMLAENDCVSLYPDPPGISETERDVLIQPMLDQTIPLGCLPLNEKERKIWLDFKKLDEGNPEYVLIDLTFEPDKLRSVIPSDPVVSVIGGFAVAAFNKACVTHFKKDEQNNLHDFEYTECKYVKDTEDYFFYMSIEAIEEGILGVYETIVACSRDDGRRTLLKFVLTYRTPVGTKAMALSLSSCLISLLETIELVGNKRMSRLFGMHSSTRGRFQGKAFSEIAFFGYYHEETVKGIRRVLSLNLQLLFQPDCTRTTNPDAWSVPGPDLDTGMKFRNNGTPCMGYDYDQTSWAVRCLVCSCCRLRSLGTMAHLVWVMTTTSTSWAGFP